jgi:hypothetical protein
MQTPRKRTGTIVRSPFDPEEENIMHLLSNQDIETFDASSFADKFIRLYYAEYKRKFTHLVEGLDVYCWADHSDGVVAGELDLVVVHDTKDVSWEYLRMHFLREDMADEEDSWSWDACVFSVVSRYSTDKKAQKNKKDVSRSSNRVRNGEWRRGNWKTTTPKPGVFVVKCDT